MLHADRAGKLYGGDDAYERRFKYLTHQYLASFLRIEHLLKSNNFKNIHCLLF